MSDSPGEVQSRAVDEDVNLSHNRIRHITSIQVRNLTPFPIRDAFATALFQPSEQPQFTAHGHLSDDLDLTLSRKRSRRISVNSLRSARSNEGAGDEGQYGSTETRGRRRAGSRVSLSGIGSSSGTMRLAGSAPTIRPSNRPRTSSMTSSNSGPLGGSSSSAIAGLSAASTSLSSMLPDNSQTSLEKVIRSRLVESFVAITIPPSLSSVSQHASDASVSYHGSSPRSRSSTPPHNTFAAKDKLSSPLKHSSAPSTGDISRTTSKASAPAKQIISPRKESSSPSHLNTMKSAPAHAKAASMSSLRPNGKTPASSFSKLKPPQNPQSRTPRQPSSQQSSVPNYLSPIHYPSTNPSFTIDPLPNHDFAEWSDLSSDQMKVEIWGRVENTWLSNSPGRRKGKGKEVGAEEDPIADTTSDWKVLEEWNIKLADLVPLPNDLASHPSLLPSNTLLITMSPTGQTYYLPHPAGSSTRASSPSPGYNSDPESAVKNVRPHVGEIFPVSGANAKSGSHNWSRRRRGGDVQKDDTKTAGWQDLFKLVTLQSCVLDTERSLAVIVAEIDKILETDSINPLKREISERESWLALLREENATVHDTSAQLRNRIKSRRKLLHVRRELLSSAQRLHNEDTALVTKQQNEVADQQTRLTSLRARFSPVRTTVLTTLSAIFPIDPLIPADLLFTILSVPLPVPLSSTDPAPPLTLPAHKDVNEDSIATAFGYVAQIVQLLAAYLGKGLIYPVTCIGSRSLIRDGISAMVGPRMFPLYSKGVDTYRFEYGVFLLNKDIEMLMADRDLHALDMRHTLPNLMNLLLTLTDGEGANLVTPRSLDSPMSSVSGLESPRAESPPALQLTPASPSGIEGELPPEGNTPPASGSTTPTASTGDSGTLTKKSFLGFSPLAGFLRSRYPIVAATVKSPSENGDTSSGSSGDSEYSASAEDGEEEEDRRTIRGVVMDAGADGGMKPGNGHANSSVDDGGKKEKVLGGDICSAVVNQVT